MLFFFFDFRINISMQGLCAFCFDSAIFGRAIRRPPAGGGLRVDNGDKAATGPLMGQRREDGGPSATEELTWGAELRSCAKELLGSKDAELSRGAEPQSCAELRS